jgi:hypothetical protein
MSLISDLEKIVSDYTDPSTYQNLIRMDPKLYSWNLYINTLNPKFSEAIKYNSTGLFNALLKKRDLNFSDILNIIQYDNVRFLKTSLHKFPHFAIFELFIYAVEYNSRKSLSFLIDKFSITDEQYFQILSMSVDFDDLSLLKFLHKKTPLTLEEIQPLENMAKIYKFKDIIKFLSSLQI